MRLPKLISRSFFHYFRANITAAAGLAVATAIITGALIIGDSLSHSLEKTVKMRLGKITHTITSGERLFTMELGTRFEQQSGLQISAGLVAEGMAATAGGRERLNRVQIIGIDNNFGQILGSGPDFTPGGAGQVIISENMARRLDLQEGDFFQLSIKRTGVIPANTPLGSDADRSVSRRVMVAEIAADSDYGRFNLRVSQTAPFNVFIDLKWLNMIMELDRMANVIFISSPGMETADLMNSLEKAWAVEDANLTLHSLPPTGKLGIGSERVFIQEHVTSKLAAIFPGSRMVLTYLANSLEKGDNSTPYSFVAADNSWSLQPGETIINRWLAEDLSAEPGDTITMRYWETGPLRELTERHERLVIRGITEMADIASDTILMPRIPGLSDAGSCRDWDAGVPVVLERIRDKDEHYWNDYRGTPKAYISLEQGQRLWSNRFGNLTSIWLPEQAASVQDYAESGNHRQSGTKNDHGSPESGNLPAYGATGNPARTMITSALNPAELGFQVNELRDSGLQAATRGVDFGMLFGGLGAFVMLAGVMLFFLLLLFNMENRSGQIKLFSSLGYPVKLIRKIYLGEGMLTAFAGSFAGMLLAILYGRMVHQALSGLWQDIVRTDMLELVIRPSSLLTGFAAGIGIAFLVIIFSLNRYILKKPAAPGKEKNPGKEKPAGKEGSSGNDNHGNKKFTVRLAATITLFLAASAVLIPQLTSFGSGSDPLSFLIAGGLLIPAFLLLADALLRQLERKSYDEITTGGLILKNLARNRTRSLSVIIILALGIFVVVATGSHRKNAATSETHPGGGTGGFLFVAEATVPVLHDLNSRETRLDLNIPGEMSFVQFMASYADDASCLNLNQVANPRILATDPSLLSGRFSFSSGSRWLDQENPWQSLNTIPAQGGSHDLSSNLIPAVADQAVIQWGLGKKVGDTLTYTNEKGEELRLLLIGGLANSVFQGNVIISREHFLEHFPSAGGNSFFLVEGNPGREQELGEELHFIFRDHGWEMKTSVDRLNEFNSVENTYLGIFLMLGALGILLGVIGLAVVMARSIIERKNEIALYLSIGYTKTAIASLIAKEYVLLLVAGFTAGIPPALIAGLPMLLPGSQQANLYFISLLMAAILLNGLLWIAVTSAAMIKNTGPIHSPARNF